MKFIDAVGLQPQHVGKAGGRAGILGCDLNLGDAVGAAALSTVITKREQFHSNIIGQSVTLARQEVRDRIEGLTQYFRAHGVSDMAAAQ